MHEAKTIRASSGQLGNIQALRAFAALNVVLAHIIGNSVSYGYPVSAFRKLGGWGANGVDLFFVISGFIMVYVQHSKTRTPGHFFLDRILRIVPLYWSLTGVLCLLLVAMPWLFREMIFSAAWMLSSLLFISGVTVDKHPILFVGWTLEFEMLFYAIFAASLIAKKTSISVVASIIIIIIAVQMFDANAIMFEFAFGMVIGYIYTVIKCSHRLAAISIITGATALLMSIWIKTPEESRFIVCGVPSALLVFGFTNLRQIDAGRVTKIGDASYSIYLIQVFTVAGFYKIAKVCGVTDINNDILAILCLVGTALVGLLVYDNGERRIAKMLKVMKK